MKQARFVADWIDRLERHPQRDKYQSRREWHLNSMAYPTLRETDELFGQLRAGWLVPYRSGHVGCVGRQQKVTISSSAAQKYEARMAEFCAEFRRP